MTFNQAWSHRRFFLCFLSSPSEHYHFLAAFLVDEGMGMGW